MTAHAGKGPIETEDELTRPSRAKRLNALLGHADELLREQPLSSKDVQALTVKLERAHDGLDAEATPLDDPDRHTVLLPSGRWESVPEWATVSAELATPGAISRGDVVRITAQCARSGDWLPGLVASYAWGSGSTGYGASRLAKIVTTTPVEQLRRRLGLAVSVMHDSGAVEAYRLLRGQPVSQGKAGALEPSRIAGLGPAFFTKFLYFAGRNVKVPTATPEPLILDRVVAGFLRRRSNEIFAGHPGIDAPAELAAWAWADGNWYGGRYETYLAWADAATVQLRAATNGRWPNRTDAIELAAFTLS